MCSFSCQSFHKRQRTEWQRKHPDHEHLQWEADQVWRWLLFHIPEKKLLQTWLALKYFRPGQLWPRRRVKAAKWQWWERERRLSWQRHRRQDLLRTGTDHDYCCPLRHPSLYLLNSQIPSQVVSESPKDKFVKGLSKGTKHITETFCIFAS